MVVEIRNGQARSDRFFGVRGRGFQGTVAICVLTTDWLTYRQTVSNYVRTSRPRGELHKRLRWRGSPPLLALGSLGSLEGVGGGGGANYMLKMGCEGKHGVRWLYVLFAEEWDWRN